MYAIQRKALRMSSATDFKLVSIFEATFVAVAAIGTGTCEPYNLYVNMHTYIIAYIHRCIQTFLLT